MIYPTQQELLPLQFHQKFETKSNVLGQTLSPSLPLHFDKKYLPQNLCQKQYLKTVKCLKVQIGQPKAAKTQQNSKLCSYQISIFQRCRLIRDMRILDGIKTWELKHLQSLDKDNKKLYLQGLNFKLDRLKNDLDRMPSTASKQMKLQQIQNEIKQIKWRMKYIKKVI